jgi:hypothetical protein
MRCIYRQQYLQTDLSQCLRVYRTHKPKSRWTKDLLEALMLFAQEPAQKMEPMLCVMIALKALQHFASRGVLSAVK